MYYEMWGREGCFCFVKGLFMIWGIMGIFDFFEGVGWVVGELSLDCGCW